jgi:Concanavalin A-like lectin/glucanases superfamily/Domain of unknown function (DUF1929)/Bacterial Ig domain/Kelch motif
MCVGSPVALVCFEEVCMRRTRVLVGRIVTWIVALNVVVTPTLAALTISVAQAQGSSALAFSGNNYIQVPGSASLNVSNNLTVEAWAKPTSVSGFADIAGKGASYEIAVQPADYGFQVLFQMLSGGAWYSATTVASGPLAVNQWYHIAATYDGSAMRIYVNGTLMGSLTVSGSIDASTAPFRIATVDAQADNFTGEVDEVRVSNVIRYTGTFNPPSSAFTSDANTMGLWHLDEGTGTTTADSSGNANNGSLVGSPKWALDSPIGSAVSGGPVISSIGTTNVEATVATIGWATDRASTSQVVFGPTTAYGLSSPVNYSLDVSHSGTIAGLTPGSVYHYQVISQDAFGNVSASPDVTFTAASAATTSALMGEWAPLDNWPLVDVHSVLLHTGDLLMWDAWETGGTPSARLWHPSSNTFTSVPNLWSQIFCSGMVNMADGRVLVVGGHNGGEVGIKDTNIFDPASNTWIKGPNMAFSRWYPGATELADGRVVAFSGNATPSAFSNTPEIYDPASNAWSALTGISTADVHEDEYPLNFVLPNGKMFVLAPSTGATRLLDATALTYTTAVAGASPVKNGSAAMYLPGKILTTGGGPVGGASVTDSAILDMTQSTPSWQSVAPMAYPRYMHNLTVMPDGKVFAVGGSTIVDQAVTTGSRTPEMWDPPTQSWTPLAPEVNERMYHSTSVLLPDGRVLVAGGGRWSTAHDFYTAEIYSPPYLFKGPRPTITGAPASVGYSTGMTVQTPDAANITSVALTDLGSDTHRQDMNQRYVPLSFTQGNGALTVQSPANPNIAPPGYYMLWLVNSSGVPSLAQMIQVTGTAPADTQPPAVSITAPVAAATVSGSVSVSASATDNVGVSKVQFTLDGASLGSPLTAAPYALNWDSSTVANGSHTLSATASDAAGNASTATGVTVTVSNAVTPPAITAVTATNVTSTGATVTWTTSKPATTQVEYGTTTAYGSTSALDNALVTSHSQGLSGLGPSTTYNYAVLSKDANGISATSANFTFVTAAPAPTLLVGDQKIEAGADSNLAGFGEAFQYTATTTGTANAVYLYVDTGNTASQVTVGLYADNGANKPGTLLAQGTISAPKAGAWNSTTISSTPISAGAKYWIALLGPNASGTVKFRDVGSGGPSIMSSQTTLSALPSAWSSGASYANSPMSAYVAGATTVDTQPPTISISTPAGGASLSGSTTISASASDNVGVASVQFTLDGNNLGSPVTVAPYSVTWDTTTALNSSHTLGAKASDAAGNTGAATTVSVVVSNPVAVISAVNAAGITASGATITWTTDRPTTSQVDYGTSNLYGSSTGLNSTLTSSHSVAITGLAASTTYHYRADSKDSGGNLVNSTDFTFTTGAPAAPVISNTTATSITPIGATIAWTTDQAATSQVSYGLTPALGSATVADATLATSHSQAVSGLSPNTTYYCQVVSKNATGQQTVSSIFSFTTLPPSPVAVVGDAKIEGNADSNAAGSAEAFQYTAGASGAITRLFVYLDSTSAATSVAVGVYTNTSGNDPGTLVASGTITSPAKGTWNSVAIPGVSLTAGTRYWIAILSPSGSGIVRFRDVASGGSTEMSRQTNLTALPTTWSPGASYANSPMSAYGSP